MGESELNAIDYLGRYSTNILFSIISDPYFESSSCARVHNSSWLDVCPPWKRGSGPDGRSLSPTSIASACRPSDVFASASGSFNGRVRHRPLTLLATAAFETVVDKG